MTINEYQEKALRTASGYRSDSLLLNGVMGLCGESGECIDIVKKAMFQGHTLDREHLAEELGMWRGISQSQRKGSGMIWKASCSGTLTSSRGATPKVSRLSGARTERSDKVRRDGEFWQGVLLLVVGAIYLLGKMWWEYFLVSHIGK